jgi:hypothetical protein
MHDGGWPAHGSTDLRGFAAVALGSPTHPLADAQTSGGLLIAIPEGGAGQLRAGLERLGVRAAEIGAVQDGAPGEIRLVSRARMAERD